MLKSPIAPEVKQEILEKIKQGAKVVAVGAQYGVSDKTIYTWLRRKAMGKVSLLEHNRLKNENQQLKQIIGVLTLEIEKAKKRSEITELLAGSLNFVNKSLVATLLGIARAALYQGKKRQRRSG